MKLFPSHITVYGNNVEVEKLLQTRFHKSGWEREWLDFLSEWYDANTFIEVQTSGSTGAPKNIQLKKTFIAESALRTIRFFDLQPGDKVLHCLPARYIAGKLMLVRAIVGKLDLHPIDPASDFQFLSSETHFHFAAMVVNQAAKCSALKSWNLDFLLLGGSSIPKSLEDMLQTRETQCFSGYAMTETATHIALRALNGCKKSPVYECLEGIKVGLNNHGCLRIEMSGLPDGLLQTNDLAEVIDKKHFTILGRADNVIISGGIKYSPELLEEKLENHIPFPFLLSSRFDPKLGEKLVLVVQAEKSTSLMQDLETICRQHLSKYEQAREFIFLDTIPKTNSGKPDRRKLYQHLNRKQTD